MNTFTKELSFLSLKFKEESNEWVETPVSKTIVFNELNRRDKKQHKLHFAIISLFQKSSQGDDADKNMVLDSDELYDITVRAIKDLVILDANFTETERKELLSDSAALLDLGLWLLPEKIIPFFQILMSKPTA